MDPFLLDPNMSLGIGNLLDPRPPQQMPMVPPPSPVPAPSPAAPVGGSVPETVAQQMAQYGIGPQGVIQAGASLGDSLTPMPPPRPMEAGGGAVPGAPMDITPPGAAAAAAPAGPAGGMSGLAQTLKGVQMPQQPTPQRISTPSVPGPRGQIKSGELLALMQALGAGPGAMPSLASSI